MAEIPNEPDGLKIEPNEEEIQPVNQVKEEENDQQQTTAVTGELIQTEIVKLTVVNERSIDCEESLIYN